MDSDQNLQADFDNYKTCYWSSHALNKNTAYTLNDAMVKNEIREAIVYEMEVRGYELNRNNPDVTLNFSILDNSTQFTGFEGVYREENYWTSTELKKNMLGLKPDSEIRSNENAKEYNLKEGTLLVDYVSTNDYDLVWQGYASGLIDKDDWSEGDDNIYRAVHLLFDEYNYEAE